MNEYRYEAARVAGKLVAFAGWLAKPAIEARRSTIGGER